MYCLPSGLTRLWAGSRERFRRKIDDDFTSVKISAIRDWTHCFRGNEMEGENGQRTHSDYWLGWDALWTYE
jgi:hypothetical protein